MEILAFDLARSYLSPAQDGVFVGVVGAVLGGDLQDGRDRLQMGVDGVTDHLGDELIDQDDTDVVTSQEAPAETKKRSSLVTAENTDRSLSGRNK